MASTVVLTYDINSTVWAVDSKVGVRKATVKDVKIEVDAFHGTVVTYDLVHFKTSSGQASYDEADVYDDVDLALAAYKLLVA
jgi:hypothetical protein